MHDGFLLLLSHLNSLSKVMRCFSLGFLCSFLYPLRLMKERSGRQICRPLYFSLLFLNGYPSRPYFGESGENPRVVESIARKIHLLIGQVAVNVPTHRQSAILNDLLLCVLSAFGNHLKHSFKDVLCPYSVNFPLHILKTQPLIICVPSALHSITCGG